MRAGRVVALITPLCAASSGGLAGRGARGRRTFAALLDLLGCRSGRHSLAPCGSSRDELRDSTYNNPRPRVVASLRASMSTVGWLFKACRVRSEPARRFVALWGQKEERCRGARRRQWQILPSSALLFGGGLTDNAAFLVKTTLAQYLPPLARGEGHVGRGPALSADRRVDGARPRPRSGPAGPALRRSARRPRRTIGKRWRAILLLRIVPNRPARGPRGSTYVAIAPRPMAVAGRLLGALHRAPILIGVPGCVAHRLLRSAPCTRLTARLAALGRRRQRPFLVKLSLSCGENKRLAAILARDLQVLLRFGHRHPRRLE